MISREKWAGWTTLFSEIDNGVALSKLNNDEGMVISLCLGALNPKFTKMKTGELSWKWGKGIGKELFPCPHSFAITANERTLRLPASDRVHEAKT